MDFIQQPQTPYIKTRVQPRILYQNHQNTKIIKVSNIFQYCQYIEKRQNYMQSQKELLSNMKLDNEELKSLSYSIKCYGINKQEGKLGVQSQRRFMGGSFESQPTQDYRDQTSERISYPFKSKRLITSRRQLRDKLKLQSEIILFPEYQRSTKPEQKGVIDKILQKSRSKCKILPSPSTTTASPEIVFSKDTIKKYQSYSRLLSEAHSHDSFYKLLTP